MPFSSLEGCLIFWIVREKYIKNKVVGMQRSQKEDGEIVITTEKTNRNSLLENKRGNFSEEKA